MTRTEALIVRAVEKAIKTTCTQLRDAGLKLSVGDFTKLLQLRKELAAEQVRGVTAQWIDTENDLKPSIAE